MTGANAKIKRIYVGDKQVYPVYSYSYTFKLKTTSQIQSDWTALSGTIATNSEGFTGTSSSDVYIAKTIQDISTAKRIIITGTVVGQSINNTAGAIGFGKGASKVARYQIYGSQYSGIRLLYYSGASYFGNTVGNATGTTYKPTVTIDFENKTIVGSISGFNDSTITLTDSQVNDIRTYTEIQCYVSLNTSTISDISIKVEY